MKNLFILIAIFLAISCGDPKTIDDARMVKVGMTTKDLKYYMGEPYEIEVNSYGEEWYFRYDGGNSDHRQTMWVTIKDDKVESFYSY